ncbi:LamG-like jellyroll fold domain-containing protein [Flagellimonas sp. 2504JD1-5]
MKKHQFFIYSILVFLTGSIQLIPNSVYAQEKKDRLLYLDFEKSTFTESGDSIIEQKYVKGISGRGLDLFNSDSGVKLKKLDAGWFNNQKDFSIILWVKSDVISKDTAIVLSNADFKKEDMGIYGKRRINNGFTLYSTNGSWGWNLGNGKSHYNYEPLVIDQPVADGKWHQIGITHDADHKEVRLFYDGVNRATLSIGDLLDQDFASQNPLQIGNNRSIDGYNSFPGVVDEVQIWGKTLSREQVKNLYSRYLKNVMEPEIQNDILTVLNWNIWHGGTHFLKDRDGFDGVERIIELIKRSNADIVLMQETYGAGSRISSSLGYYYYEASSSIGAVWGANLSIMSRFPMEEVYMIEEASNYGKNYAFNNGGAKIRLSANKSVVVFSNWYNGNKPEDLEGALKKWETLVKKAGSTPMIWAGDFNSISHLDDGMGKSGHSKLMTKAGFTDAYRELYPDSVEYASLTSPSGQSRIDFIYYKGTKLKLIEAGMLIKDFQGKFKHSGYPSDHLGITAKFKVN